jgi:uncharacterized protein involved in exopolysaccharide biosynthesis
MLDYNRPIDRARPEPPQRTSQAGFNVLELADLLWRRRIAIAAAALLGAALAVCIGKSLTPRYTATAQLYVDPRELQLVDRELTPRAQDVSGMAMVVESQARLITSNSVLLQVIQQAGLEKDPEFGGGASASPMASLLGLIGLQPPAPSAAEKKEVQLAALDTLNRHITIRKTEKSFIVDIEVWSTDPAKAAMLANTLTSAYLAESRNSQASAARRATNDLSSRLKELRDRLRNAETALATYKAQNNFVGTQDALISDQQLSASNQRLSAAAPRRWMPRRGSTRSRRAAAPRPMLARSRKRCNRRRSRTCGRNMPMRARDMPSRPASSARAIRRCARPRSRSRTSSAPSMKRSTASPSRPRTI